MTYNRSIPSSSTAVACSDRTSTSSANRQHGELGYPRWNLPLHPGLVNQFQIYGGFSIHWRCRISGVESS
jgi:hypothetical protein